MYLLTIILSSCLSNCALVVFNDFFLVTITSLFGFVLARITANDEEHCAFFRDQCELALQQLPVSKLLVITKLFSAFKRSMRCSKSKKKYLFCLLKIIRSVCCKEVLFRKPGVLLFKHQCFFQPDLLILPRDPASTVAS